MFFLVEILINKNSVCNVKFCLLTAELERKMSTRRTRQELIEQGVLKEVPDSGKSASVIHLISLHNGVCIRQQRPEAITPTQTVQLSHQYIMAGTLSS